MGTVGTGFSMSLDGFIAGPGDDVRQVFAWYGSGDSELRMPNGGMTIKVSSASAEMLRELHQSIGALVTGRRMFDLTKGWGGSHPLNVPVFVVTHSLPQGWDIENSPFTFVTDGVERAVEQARVAAGEKNVAVDRASIVQQAIKAGLIDEIGIDLVPVLLGAGIRYFDHLEPNPINLELIKLVEGTGVTHLRYRVLK
jgi:dihydrofolate reductase